MVKKKLYGFTPNVLQVLYELIIKYKYLIES